MKRDSDPSRPGGGVLIQIRGGAAAPRGSTVWKRVLRRDHLLRLHRSALVPESWLHPRRPAPAELQAIGLNAVAPPLFS